MFPRNPQTSLNLDRPLNVFTRSKVRGLRPSRKQTVHGDLQFFDQKWFRQIRQSIRFEKSERARRDHVPGNKKNLVPNRTPGANERVVEGDAIKPRHAQVADHQIVIASGDARETFLAVERGFDPVAFLAQDVDDQLCNRRLVFDHENVTGGNHAGLVRNLQQRRCAVFRRNRDHRQVNNESRAHAWKAFDRHFPAVLLHDSVNDRESQAGSDPERLGREKRIENSRCNFAGNARPVIGKFDENSICATLASDNACESRRCPARALPAAPAPHSSKGSRSPVEADKRLPWSGAVPAPARMQR